MGKKWKDSLEAKKLRFLELYNQGLRGLAIAKRLQLNESDCKSWCTTIRLFGTKNFLDLGTYRMKYSYETKLAAVKAVVDEGQSTSDVMLKYGIVSKQTFKTWKRIYRSQGEQGLQSKRLGRPRKVDIELTTEQKLRQRILELELENEILKKVQALTSSQP